MIAEFDVTEEDRNKAMALLAEYDSETIGKWDLISDLSDSFTDHKIKYMFVFQRLLEDELIEYREEGDDFLIHV